MAPPRPGDPEGAPARETDVTGGAGGRGPRVWDDARLQRALDLADAGAWGPVAVLPSTGSTNADAAEQAREGAPEGFTVVADEQTVGRGRLDRRWESPPGAGLALSVVVRPRTSVESWGWLPLLTGVAVVDALVQVGVPARLKWPNDVVVDAAAWDGSAGPRKLGGILVERVADAEAVVVGVGVNVDLRRDELPVPQATSCVLEGVEVRRETLLVDVLERLRGRVSAWVAAAGDARRCGLADDYAERCATLGREVRVVLPGGLVEHGTAESLDRDGRLRLRRADGTAYVVSAGDVEHVR